jgi:uncharacterized tellurite resistance protein B-like protein
MSNRRLSSDEALIALIIAAMESSGHVAPAEAARAAELVRLMPQRRRQAKTANDRLVERMKAYVRDHDDNTIIDAAWDAIPRDARARAVMIVMSVLVSDHRLQRPESAFLRKLTERLVYHRPVSNRPPARHRVRA